MNSYSGIAKHAEAPVKQRKALVNGRGGNKVAPRKYHKTEEELQNYVVSARKAGRFIPPYRNSGAYWGVVEALVLLGPNKKHPFANFMLKLQEVMSDPSTCKKGSVQTAWDRFNKRTPRSQTNARDILAKILENIEVVQRLNGNNPYGLKLLQVGAVVNLYDESDGFFVELRLGQTGSTNPINTRRKKGDREGVDVEKLGVPYCIIETCEEGIRVGPRNISLPE